MLRAFLRLVFGQRDHRAADPPSPPPEQPRWREAPSRTISEDVANGVVATVTFATGHHGFVSVVGESQYQEALSALAGRLESDGVFTARLVPEPDNPHDATAVAVCVDGSLTKVGYLARGVARSYHPALARRQEAVTCPARLTGVGAGSIGVVLDFEEVRVALGLPRVSVDYGDMDFDAAAEYSRLKHDNRVFVQETRAFERSDPTEAIARYRRALAALSKCRELARTKGLAAYGFQPLRIFHIDVESADAALLVMPNGKALLIDSGGNGRGARIKKAMDDAGVSQIDVFVNSHYHEDHFGGIDELVDAGTPVLESFDRGEKAKCFSTEQVTAGRFGDYMRTVGEDARALRPGDTIAIDPLVTITVIGSSGRVIGDTAPVSHCHENDLSVSLLMTFAGFTVFFGGDTEKPTEAKIASRDLVMNVDVYKASHHGSDTSSSAALMNDLQPSVVIISNGSHKGFKHPRQVTLNTYHALKPTAPVVFQTNKCLHPSPCGNEPNASIADPESSDEDGTIAVTVDAATSSYTTAFGSTTRPFAIKNPAAPVVTVPASIVITSMLPNPAGNGEQLEEVTIENKGTAAVSLVGWTLRDRSGATWNLSGSIGAGTPRTFRRNNQAMSLNNAGDEIALIDNADIVRDRFEYTASAEGTRVVTGH